MPYKSRKVRNKNCYKVYKNDKTKKVFAKCATKENAKKQMRLLRAIQSNKNFKPNARRNMGGKSRKNKTLKQKGGYNNRRDLAEPPRLVSGNYIRIRRDEVVNIIDTRFTEHTGVVDYIPHSLESSIEGVIIGQAGLPFARYYHMVVTRGNRHIEAGTHIHIDMFIYNAISHPPFTNENNISGEEKDGDEDGYGDNTGILVS